MAHKQARRRKPAKSRQMQMPSIPVGTIATLLGALGIVIVAYQASARILDRPIQSVEIRGPMQRVSALQIEDAIDDELSQGFFGANLSAMQQKIARLDWIDGANVARRWPGRIVITFGEQVPAAQWGDAGLLNTRGELFVSAANHVPAELPKLSGPPDQSALVARRYLEIRNHLIPLGMDVRELQLDKRGSWRLTLQNGVEVRLGRRDVQERTDLFFDVVADIVSSRENAIEFVDMRYSNGFTIGWKPGGLAMSADPHARLVADRAAR